MMHHFKHYLIKSWSSPASFSLFSSFLTVESKQMFDINVCRRLDSNRGPLVIEATALLTKPQQLPQALPITIGGKKS